MLRAIILAVLVVGLAPVTNASSMQRTYSIGNSLTWDSRPWNYGLNADAAAGTSTSFGYHIRCGLPLNYIVSHPTETCVDPTSFGTFEPALTNYAWDAISIQPFPGNGSTLATDVSAINTFANMAPSATPYVFAAWPSRPAIGSTFATSWNLTSSGLDNQPTILSRDYFDDLMSRVLTTRPNAKLIPVGDVFFKFEQEIAEGRLPTFTSIRDLYRDDLHLSNVGRFLATTTAISTIYKLNPVGLPIQYAVTSDYQSVPWAWPTDQTITPELRDQLQSIVWDVVSTNQYTGVPEPTGLLLLPIAALMMRRRR